ncbi:MAG TPA: PadR family transcriptional regulator [Gemmatimonadaceae bacterium]|jgi:transcriptional regulator
MARLGVLKGTLDTLVLKMLTWAPMHGFEIMTRLEAESNDVLELEDAALYQALRRMEERGFVEAELGVTENNRKARYYSITARGRAQLRAETANWNRYATMVSEILARTTPRSTT